MAANGAMKPVTAEQMGEVFRPSLALPLLRRNLGLPGYLFLLDSGSSNINSIQSACLLGYELHDDEQTLEAYMFELFRYRLTRDDFWLRAVHRATLEEIESLKDCTMQCHPSEPMKGFE